MVNKFYIVFAFLIACAVASIVTDDSLVSGLILSTGALVSYLCLIYIIEHPNLKECGFINKYLAPLVGY